MSLSPEQKDPKAPPKKDVSFFVMMFIFLSFGVVFLSSPAQKMWIKMQMQGEEAPSFSLKPVFGQEDVRLQDYKGKVVLLDFWTTWCPPCRDQMPVLEKLHNDKKYKDSLRILSINADEDSKLKARKVRLYLKHFKLTFPTAYADKAALVVYKVTSFPTLVVIGKDGKVTAFLRGIHTEAQIRQHIEEAMKS